MINIKSIELNTPVFIGVSWDGVLSFKILTNEVVKKILEELGEDTSQQAIEDNKKYIAQYYGLENWEIIYSLEELSK